MDTNEFGYQDYLEAREQARIELEQLKCYRPVYEHEKVQESTIKSLEHLGGITSNKDEVTCQECLSWIHA